MPDLNDVVWFIGAASLLVCLAVAAWMLILVVAGWAASVGFLRGATEVPCFYRQENFRQRIGDGSEKTFAREHPVDSFWGLGDRWSGRWFFGLMRLGDPVRLPGAVVCDVCDGTGRNTNDQLWPAHALCRACGGSGAEPPVTHTWDGEKMPVQVITAAMIDVAFKSLPPDARGTIAPGEMERLLKRVFDARSQTPEELTAYEAVMSLKTPQDMIKKHGCQRCGTHNPMAWLGCKDVECPDGRVESNDRP